MTADAIMTFLGRKGDTVGIGNTDTLRWVEGDPATFFYTSAKLDAGVVTDCGCGTNQFTELAFTCRMAHQRFIWNSGAVFYWKYFNVTKHFSEKVNIHKMLSFHILNCKIVFHFEFFSKTLSRPGIFWFLFICALDHSATVTQSKTSTYWFCYRRYPS